MNSFAGFVNFVNMSIKGENNTSLLIAKEHKQSLQMELLVQNRAIVPGNEDEESGEPVNKQGYLFKTGSERTGWRKRYCSLDKTGFKYYTYITNMNYRSSITPANAEDILDLTRLDTSIRKDQVVGRGSGAH
ncbi:uncharacterized protein [Dysidea avara]|uniref:uncharacterized protein n=1 Tax=Dysidea avara TaxID=196820 RepID=UPI003333B803